MTSARFSNLIKKELFKIYNYFFQAEGWLDSQAQQQGWMKAEKLQHRTTLHGLVGVSFDNNKAAMVSQFQQLKKFNNLYSA